MKLVRSPPLRDARSAPVAGRPDPVTFETGHAMLCAVHPELSRQPLGAHERLLRLGAPLWREGRHYRNVDEDDPNQAGRIDGMDRLSATSPLAECAAAKSHAGAIVNSHYTVQPTGSNEPHGPSPARPASSQRP